MLDDPSKTKIPIRAIVYKISNAGLVQIDFNQRLIPNNVTGGGLQLSITDSAGLPNGDLFNFTWTFVSFVERVGLG